MKSIKQQYIDLQEGNMSQANFMRNLRMTMPHLVTNVTSFDDSVKILRNKGILTEADMGREVQMTAAEELAKQMGDYESAVVALEDEMGLSPQEANAIASRIFPDDEEEIAAMIAQAEEEESGKYTKFQDFPGAISEEKTSYAATLAKKVAKDYGNELKQIKSQNHKDYETKALNYVQKLMTPKNIKDLRYDEDFYPDYISALSDELKKGSLKEAKDEKTKWTNTSGKSMYDQFDEINNLNGQEVLIGIDYEIEKNPELTKVAAAKIVIKNLKKNPIYYTASLMSGVEGYEPEYIGGKSANAEARQMQPLDKNMGNVVDKKMGMQPVKGIEKPKKDSDSATAQKYKTSGISLMSLVAKTARGVKKMDPTGEKMKKIAIKESKEERSYQTNVELTQAEQDIIKKLIPDATFEWDEDEQKQVVYSKKSAKKNIQRAIEQATGQLKTSSKIKPGIGDAIQSKLTKESLMQMIREELKEMFDGMEPMDRTGLDNI